MKMTTPAAAGPLRRFSARFDDLLLRAPQADRASPGAPVCADAAALESALLVLCQLGPRYASASHTLAATPDLRALQQLWLQQRLLALDGTLHMQSLGGPWRQRLHRLAIKLLEAAGSGAAQAGAPWDCGFLQTTPAALQRAEQFFLPRRPTLMLAWQLPARTLQPFAAALYARRVAYAQPVRLWVLKAPIAD